MSRRIALPGADELFRSTGENSRNDGARTDGARTDGGRNEAPAQGPTLAVAALAEPDLAPVPLGAADQADLDALDEVATTPRVSARRRPRPVSDRRPSGRERHDEKITVYVSPDELMDLEHARLALRGDHGLPVDRGRVVREALAVVLADFEAKGEASILVRRLRGR